MDGCCSKCWRELQATNARLQQPTKAHQPQQQATKLPSLVEATSKVESDSQSQTQSRAEADVPATAGSAASHESKEDAPGAASSAPLSEKPKAAPSQQKKKTKKKKLSYKQMMNSMMSNDGKPKDTNKDADKLLQGVGGGAFSKIDKI